MQILDKFQIVTLHPIHVENCVLFSYCALSTNASVVGNCKFDISVLTPWSTDDVENLTVIKLVKKCPTSHGTQRFIIIFKRSGLWAYREPNWTF